MDVSIRPEVNILSVLRHLNYRPWFALAEFVDNSLGSYLASQGSTVGQPLRVSIEMDANNGGRVLVTDNAAGIAPADFPRAFRAAEVPPDRSGLSEFGMGMKSAASWFARKWSVRTTVEGDPIERSISFDLAEITRDRVESLAVVENPVSAASHYTVIELTQLNHIPQTATVTKIRNHLASIYRQFLREGSLQLTFKGEKLEYPEVDALVAPRAGEPESSVVRWVKDIEFELSGGQQIRGFAGVRAVGSTSQAGFALMRRGRLITGSHDEPYRPAEIFGRSNTYTYQRLFGEFYLEGFEVSHTKDGFRWDELEDEFLQQLEEELRREPLNLLAQASNYRAKLVQNLIAPIEAAASKVASAVEDHLEPVLAQISQQAQAETAVPDEVISAVAHSIRRTVSVQLDMRLWVVEIEATLDESVTDWIQVGAVVEQSSADDGDAYRVDVSVSLAHPFSRKFLGASNENAELIIAIASALGLALALGKLNGAKSYSILNHLNKLARETFAIQSAAEEVKL